MARLFVLKSATAKRIDEMCDILPSKKGAKIKLVPLRSNRKRTDLVKESLTTAEIGPEELAILATDPSFGKKCPGEGPGRKRKNPDSERTEDLNESDDTQSSPAKMVMMEEMKIEEIVEMRIEPPSEQNQELKRFGYVETKKMLESLERESKSA